MYSISCFINLFIIIFSMHSTLDNISKNGNLAPARISATMRNMRKT